jgi:hypothetical protein
MRNPNRIPILIEKFQKIWTAMPDLRFGQLCVIIFGSEDKMFNMEDDEFEKRLDAFLTKICL